MAIDPLQRQMFGVRPGALPGVDPRNVAGGIYNLANMGNPQPPVPVAAQPLQVASLGPQPERTIIAPSQPNFQQQYDQATAQINAARQEQVPETDISALLEARSQIVEVAESAGQTLTIGDDDDERIDDGTNAILTATDNAQTSKVAETEGATDTDANVARTNATNLAQSLLNADKDPDMKALLAALGPSEINYDDWKKQSKELLGIEEGEADVPDWAAPMFLFGLNLMKGPVSGKVQGQTGLGGLLSDIGAAGEKGFAFFATERARKRKEKAQVATVAMQLQSADTARKKLAVDAYRIASASRQNLTKAVGSAYNDSINRVLKLVPDGQEEKRVLGIAAYGQQYRELKRAGVTDRQLLNPATQQLLESHAANEMGITKTPVKLDSMKFGGIDLNFSRSDLESARTGFNKANPQNQIGTMTEFLSKIIAKDPLVQNYQSLVIGQRADNVTSGTLNSVNDDGEKITEVILTNEAAREQWFADNAAPPANASQAEKEAYAEKVRAATPTWQFTTETRLTDQPNYTERSFVNEDGTETKFYINEAAYGARRRSQPNLTLQDVLLNPDKYPKIMGGKVKDFSKLQPNLENILVYDGGLKRTFVIDKNAAGRALAEGKIEPGEGRDKLVELGLGRFIGEGVPVKPNEKIQIMKVVNGMPTVTTIEAKDAGQALEAFTSKADAKDWGTRQTSLVTLNTTAFEIDKLLKERGIGVTSSLTDIAGSALTLSKIGGSVFNTATARDSRAAMNAAPNTTGETRDLLQQAFSDDIWKNVVENKEQRGAVKSMFINLAFSLASSREGGKLTDNDVKNALETLGWDGSAWTLTPGQVTARLKVATRTANDQYINDSLNRINDPAEKEAYLKTQDRDEPDFVEKLLQERARAIKGAMHDRYTADNTAPLRFDRAFPEETDNDAEAAGRRRLLPVDQSFELGIPANNRGVFSSQVDTRRMPNTLRTIHKEVLFPGGAYSPVSSVADLSTRIRSPETATRLKALGLTEQAVTDLVNEYLKYYSNNPDLLVAPQ
jgi:hypothetical protein